MNLAIIIARKNSKRLKNKNLLKIGKYNLLQLTLIETLKVNQFSKIIVNTDLPKIEKQFKFLNKKKFNKIIFIKRSKKLATDKAKAVDVVLESIKKINDKRFKTISLLLPTCPLRKSTDIKKGLKLLKKNLSSTISVCKTNFPPEFCFSKNHKNFLKPKFRNSPLLKSETRTQLYSNSFRPNGGFYISWITKLRKNKNFFRGKILGVEMPLSRSIDIDTFEDLNYARYNLNKKLNK